MVWTGRPSLLSSNQKDKENFNKNGVKNTKKISPAAHIFYIGGPITVGEQFSVGGLVKFRLLWEFHPSPSRENPEALPHIYPKGVQFLPQMVG